MIQFILMLLSLAFGSHHANTTTSGNNQKTETVQSNTDSGTGDGGPVGGNTGQTPPPFTNP